MKLLERVEIRPKRIRNAALIVLGAAAFVAAGVWMIAFSRYLLPVGLVSIGVSGGCVIIAVPRLLRRRTSLVLTPASLELGYPQGTVRIGWDQIEAVGLFNLGRQKLVGLRLRNPSDLGAGLPDALARAFAGNLTFLRASAFAASGIPTLPGSEATARWRRPLREFAGARSLDDVLAWNREHFGFDLCFSWVDRDRPADRFADLLERYRAAPGVG